MYLKCEGEVISGAGKTGANLDLALRDNNQSALIQRSNILPVGEKMRYEVSPASYSMVYRSPDTRSRVYYDWRRGYCSAGIRGWIDSPTSGCRLIARQAGWRATS